MAKFNSLSEALNNAANFDVMGESKCGSKNEEKIINPKDLAYKKISKLQAEGKPYHSEEYNGDSVYITEPLNRNKMKLTDFGTASHINDENRKINTITTQYYYPSGKCNVFSTATHPDGTPLKFKIKKKP